MTGCGSSRPARTRARRSRCGPRPCPFWTVRSGVGSTHLSVAIGTKIRCIIDAEHPRGGRVLAPPEEEPRMSSAAVPGDHVVLSADQETLAANEEKSKLKKHFGRFDMLLLPDLHARRRGHARRGRQQRRRGLHLADLPGRPLLRPLRAPDGRARLRVHRARAAATSGRASRSGASWRAINSVLYWLSNPVWMGGLLLHHRGHDVQHVLRRPRQRRQVPVRAGVHLVRRVGGDPVLRRRQVDPDARRLGAHRAARRSSRSASSSTRLDTACTRRRSASSRRPTRSSSRSCRCCSSTSSASSCRTPPATR